MENTKLFLMVLLGNIWITTGTGDDSIVAGGHVLLSGKWIDGFRALLQIYDIQLQHTKEWSIVVYFDRPLGKDIMITSWNMDLLWTKNNSQAIAFYNPRGLLSSKTTSKSMFSAVFDVRRIEWFPTSAHVALYSEQITNDSYIVPISLEPIRSLQVNSDHHKLEESLTVKKLAKGSKSKVPGKNKCKISSGKPKSGAKQTVLKFAPNKDGTKYNYNEVLHKSILFYEAQRSGRLPPSQRVSWRGDSALQDGCDLGVDVTGGWYDGGNFMKFNFPMAFSLTTLAWGGIVFRDAYEDSGEMEHMTELVKWAAKYFIRCHISKYEFVGQVGNLIGEQSNWGRPEEMIIKRPSFKITDKKPGTELAAEASAALAASSIFLKSTHSELAKKALKHAEELYEFADKYRSSYHISIPEASSIYKSYSGYEDELLWAAAWLYKATENNAYLKAVTKLYSKMKGQYITGDVYSWDSKLVGAQALLADLTSENIYRTPFSNYLDSLEVARTNPKGMYYHSEWSPNRYTAGAAFMAVIGASLKPALPRKKFYKKWAEKQIGLLLGDSGKSYVIGFGKNYPKKSHHRSSSCPPYPKLCDWETFKSPNPNHYILYGALVGGPDEDGAFVDKRENAKQNQVGCDYNAGFQSAIAGLKHFAIIGRGSIKSTANVVATELTPLTTLLMPTDAKNTTRIFSVSETTVVPSKLKPSTARTTKKTPNASPKTPKPLPRCGVGKATGKPVFNAKQTPLNFKPNNDGTKHNYNEVLHKSILFFEAQRAGKLPLDHRVPWRGDSTLKDGCDVGADVSGGWFDAGDHVKFNFPMAFSLTTLAWGGIVFRKAYEDAGELQNLINSLKWPTKYFINAHVSKYELIAQVGNGKLDHDSWGRPETMSMKRPTYKITAKKPGTELAAEAAAALAASSIFLKPTDPKLAQKALKHAKELYEFADKYRGLYHVSVPDAKIYYKSVSGYDDELIWGAAWLYKATRDKTYLRKAVAHYNRIKGKYVVETRFSWDRKLSGAQALLADLTGEAIYRDPLTGYLNYMLKAKTTPQGLHFIAKWGSNRYAAGAALIAAVSATLKPPLPKKALYLKWAQKQIGLVLGDGGYSFVVGYGENYPKRPHHRGSTCPPYPKRCDWSTFRSPLKNHYILYGALVGGPDSKGKYLDIRPLYEQTEVTCDYNACFQTAVAGVKYFAMQSRRKSKNVSTAKPASEISISVGRKPKRFKNKKGKKKGKCKPKRSTKCAKDKKQNE